MTLPKQNNIAPLRVLCLDNEGGHGGSSKSLFEFIRNMDRTNLLIEVWCRRGGPIIKLYADLGVTCTIVSRLPCSSINQTGFRDNLNLIRTSLPTYLKSIPELFKWGKYIQRNFDLVHFNHPGFFILAKWLRVWCRMPFVIHLRTRPPECIMARWQAGIVSQAIDHAIFITENERDHWMKLAPTIAGTVIYNIPPPAVQGVGEHLHISQCSRLKIASLSNYSHSRGVDRVVDLAVALASIGAKEKVLFVMAGDMAIPKNLPGRLGKIGALRGNLRDLAIERGVQDMFLFLGHVTDTPQILNACDMLIKLTREANPWGRDIIEAMASSRPAISLGSWDVFVVDGVTGIIKPEFDAPSLALELTALEKNRGAVRELGRQARHHIEKLCDGPTKAAELIAVWQERLSTPE